MRYQPTTFSKWFMLGLALVLLLAPMTVSAHGPGGHHGRSNWHLNGTITAMPDQGLIGDWAIDDEAFITNGQTSFDQDQGDFAIGTYVHATGYYDGEQRIAYRVETSSDYQDCGDSENGWRLYGTVDGMPQDLIEIGRAHV